MDIGGIILTVVLVVFILLTILFLKGRGTYMLNGLGFKSCEDLKRFNPKKMMQFLGKCMVIFDISIVLLLVSYLLKIEWISVVGAVLILITCIGASIYIKTDQRFLD